VELAIKSHHRPIFDLVRLREGSERVLAGAKVSESWPVLPSQLAGFAHRQVAERSGDASLAVLPYALIGKWSFQKEGKVSDKSFPALDLSDPKVRALVADVAKAENSASLAAVARESGGLLVPSFGARSHYEGCFKQEEGRVELNAEIERCRNLGIKYMVTAKHAAATSAAITGSCKVEKIRLFGTTTDIDPCFPEYE